MTEQEIKQNAEAYADKAAPITEQNKGIPLAIHTAAEVAYIAGAHSRDEEIRELLEKYTYKIDSLIAQKEDLQAELDELRNPWISVEERLPEIGDIVVINVHHTIDGGGEHHEDDQILIENYNGRWMCDRCEQHRIGKHLFDTISKTTHWIPISPIEKGGEK